MSIDIDELKEAAEAPEYWIEGVGKISTALINTMTVYKRTILALIADLEETRVHWIHKGLRLATAEKLIKAQHEALAAYDAMNSEEYAAECLSGTIADVTVTALALYDAYEKEDTHE